MLAWVDLSAGPMAALVQALILALAVCPRMHPSIDAPIS